MPLNAFDINKFPVPLDQYKPVPLSLGTRTLTAEQKDGLSKNIKLLRDAIVFFTASGAARGGTCPPSGSPCTPSLCVYSMLPWNIHH